MKAHQLTFIGILVAVLVTGGYVLYWVSRFLPVPGSKFLVMAPYLGLIMAIALFRLPSPWTMSKVSVVFGVVVSLFTPVMGVTIVTAGLLSDFLSRLMPANSKSFSSLAPKAALYPMLSLVLSLFVSNVMTGNVLYGALGLGPFLFAALLAYGLGLLGAYLGLRIVARVRGNIA